MNRHRPMTKADDVRETPPELFNALNEKHRFTLDVCASAGNHKTPLHFRENGLWYNTDHRTADWNGLTGPWEGRVWCNPPFSEIATWIAKCWREMARRGGPELIWFLIPATRTEQDWWHKLVEPYRDGRAPLVAGVSLTTRFLKGRIHFLENGGPIYRKNKDGSLWINPKTGEPERSAPKFGCVGLVWSRVPAPPAPDFSLHCGACGAGYGSEGHRCDRA